MLHVCLYISWVGSEVLTWVKMWWNNGLWFACKVLYVNNFVGLSCAKKRGRQCPPIVWHCLPSAFFEEMCLFSPIGVHAAPNVWRTLFALVRECAWTAKVLFIVYRVKMWNGQHALCFKGMQLGCRSHICFFHNWCAIIVLFTSLAELLVNELTSWQVCLTILTMLNSEG